MNQKTSHAKVFVLIGVMLALASLACSLQKTDSSSTSEEKNTSKESSNEKEKSQLKELTAQEIIDKSTDAMKSVRTLSLQLNITSGSSGYR